VLRYDGQTGAYLGAFIAANSGGLVAPAELLFEGGSLYVSSQNTNEVLRYDAQTGAFLDHAATAGQGGLDRPVGLLLDSDNNLLVGSNAEVLRYGPRSLASFTVRLSMPSTSSVTVDYATVSGSAMAGRDFMPVSGTLTFAPGQTTQTVVVLTVDDHVVESTETFSLTLSNPVGVTVVRGDATGTILDDNTTKFFVVDAGSTDNTYRYGISGNALGSSALDSGDTAPRGVASDPAGTTVWVVDANQTVYVYDPSGVLLGSWTAGGLPANADVAGITTDGTDIWLLENSSHSVYHYAGAAGLLSGSQNADSSFTLADDNADAKGLVTDGQSFWLVDGSTLQVYKYTLWGALLGSWAIDPANANPTGITINPNNVSDIWIVDSGTLQVYQYIAAADRTYGSQAADAAFALAPGDTNPQGIADPPPNLAPTPIRAPAPRPLRLALAQVSSLPSRDAVFALLARAVPQWRDEPSVHLTASGAFSPASDCPPPVADRALPSVGASVWAAPSGGTSHALRSNRAVVGLLDGGLADEENWTSALPIDSSFALRADDAPAMV
jgi:hypothetical protein